MSYLGEWSGQNIICVGEFSKSGDHPLGLFTPEEDSKISQFKDGNGGSLNLFDLAVGKYRRTSRYDADLLRKISQNLRLSVSKCFDSMRYFDVYQTIGTLQPKLSDFYPVDESWILRNLTSKEFVRSETIALRPEYIQGPHIKVIGFGEVILSRTCWSTDPSVDIRCKGAIHRGAWAGHRFDITTLSRHMQEVQEAKDEQWKDCSEEVVKEVVDIWKAKYGSRWREYVCFGADFGVSRRLR